MWEFNNTDLPAVSSPTGGGGAVLCGDGIGGGACFEIDWQAEWDLPDVITGTDAIALGLPVDFSHPATNPGAGIYAIDLSLENPEALALLEDAPLSHVTLLTFNGNLYTAAADPANLQEHEFSYNPNNQQLIFKTAIATAGTSGRAAPLQPQSGKPIQIYGRRMAGSLIAGSATVPSTELSPGVFPPLLRSLPLVGEFSWDLSLEEHPSASMKLLATYQTAPALRAAFRRGNEYEFFGIGFRVANLQEAQGNMGLAAGGCYFFAIRLEGKWRYPLERQPVYLRRQGTGANPPIPGGTNPSYDYNSGSDKAYEDSECQTSGGGGTGGITTALNNSTETAQQFTSIQDLGKQIDVTVEGPPLPIEIPPDTQPDSPLYLNSLLEERLRIQGCFVDYSSANGVRCVKLGEGRSWSFAPQQLFPLSEDEGINIYLTNDYRDTNSPQKGGAGSALWPQPGSPFPSDITPEPIFSLQPEDLSLIGYGTSFPPTKLEFPEKPATEKPKQYNYTSNKKNDPEPTPNNKMPRFKRRARIEKTFSEGDTENLGSPPPDITYLSLDLLWTKSGPTKTEITHTTLDGMPKRDVVSTWGFMGTALLGLTWGEVKRENTEHHYDEATGYYLGSTTTGFQWTQLLQENLQNPETAKLSKTDPKYKLYEFKLVNIRARTRKLLHQFRDYYQDAATGETPLYDLFKTCNRDGSSSVIPIYNPNFVSGMFEVEEATKRDAYTFARNPDYSATDPEKSKLPKYYTSGEDTYNRIKRTILPATKNAMPRLGEFRDISINAQPNAVDSYSEYRSDFSSSGALFSDAAENTGTSVNQGRPGAATRLPELYELEEQPVETNSNNNDDDDDNGATISTQNQADGTQIERIICTPPYSLSDPVQGSKSYPLASNYQEALTAFKTELTLADIRQTVTTNLSVPFNSAIRPGDKAAIAYGSESYQRIVLSVSGKINFLGLTADGTLTCAWQPLSLTAGIDRNIPVSEKTNKINPPKPPTAYTSRTPKKKPGSDELDEVDLFFLFTNGLVLGETMPYTSARISQYG